MTLATVGADGRPSTRIVLIKGFDERGIVWYTNYESRKGRELAAPPARRAAVPLGRARARRAHRGPGREGRRRTSRTPTSPSRPLDSRIGAWASPQSEVIASRGDAGRQRRPLRRPVHAAAAAAAALGRLSAAAGPSGSSGRAASRACTTGCATGATAGSGCASASRPEARPRPAGAGRSLRARLPSSRGPRPGAPSAPKPEPPSPAVARYLPESGYSTISGRSRVLIDRYFSGASEVLMIWCGYSGPARHEDDVAGRELEHLAGDAQGAAALEHDERLFLGVVQVVRTAAHARREDVDADAEADARRCRWRSGRSGCRTAAGAARGSSGTSSKLRISSRRRASARSLMGRSGERRIPP